MRTYNYLYKALGLVLVTAAMYGCGGGASAPTRKKMPEFNSYNGFEGAMPFNSPDRTAAQGSFAFAATNVDLMLNGSMQGFVSVSLPDPANDSAAVSLINTVKPFAMPMLTAWAQQQRHGVLIDLTGHSGSEVHRSDYVLQKQGEFSIPVVVMWDGASASRVASMKDLVQGMPSVTLSCTSGNDPSANFMGR